jgi:serine phosphatase RsbU (regulator of sigma subunit)
MIAHSGSRCASVDPAFTVAVSFAVRSFEGGERCGDVVLVRPVGDRHTAIIVVDVAGHGALRAPLSAALGEAIATSLRRDGSPALALRCADELLRAGDDECPYAVAFVALADPALQTVVYASAGLDVAFTLAADGALRHLGPTGTMLGIPLANDACDATFTIRSDETLVVVTDGISDSRLVGTAGFFGAIGTACAVTRSLRAGSDPAQAVLDAAYAHANGRQLDDVAVAVASLRVVPLGYGLAKAASSTGTSRSCAPMNVERCHLHASVPEQCEPDAHAATTKNREGDVKPPRMAFTVRSHDRASMAV